MEWTDARVREALSLAPGPASLAALVFGAVSTDTRTLGKGDLFVALVGPHFDGHDFLAEAAERGAAGAVVSVPWDRGGFAAVYPVSDTLDALGALARYRRRALGAHVIGITGSSGKTTAKELVAAALAPALRVHATRGNLNNRVGVPLTLLAAPDDAQVLVVEMGTNEPGEIRALSDVVEPDTAVVTTVSEAHTEKLGSFEGVMEEKLALIAGLPPEGTAIVGDEPAELAERARTIRRRVRVTGLSDRADARWRGELLDVDDGGRWRVRLPGGAFTCGVPGRHGVRNALVALAVADLLGVPTEDAIGGMAGVEPKGLRGETRRIGGLRVILDCYNANPQSVRASLVHLGDLPGTARRVAVLGSMLELGDRSEALHREVLSEALALPIDTVVAVGLFADAAEAMDPHGSGPELLAAAGPDTAAEILVTHLAGDELVLLKASRGVALERVLPRLEDAFGADDAAGADGGED